jgi:NAD(P)-dependent dehydrogenase (short-subunit alcohol dehydrogenase family)
VQASITDPASPSTIIDALQTHFGGKVDALIFNAAVMGLAMMGQGTVTVDFVNAALAGNVGFAVMLMERLVADRLLRQGGRVVAISSEAVREWRPSGG